MNNKRAIALTVNGDRHEILVAANQTALSLLRNQLGLTGTKYGCGTGDCCACSIIVNSKAVLSCLTLGADLDGCDVTTIEGLATANELHPVQAAFVQKGGAQCGFCTPGMIITIKALLDENPDPSEDEVRQYIRGNLCRCTGYTKIVDAALEAARSMREVE
ncbi:2Fe-2S iron-sulfur cluster binding domain-containing protein [Rhodobacteraceae bacterium Araon29]